jgi:hypothetical protein
MTYLGMPRSNRPDSEKVWKRADARPHPTFTVIENHTDVIGCRAVVRAGCDLQGETSRVVIRRDSCRAVPCFELAALLSCDHSSTPLSMVASVTLLDGC